VILKEEADKTLSHSPPWCCWWLRIFKWHQSFYYVF